MKNADKAQLLRHQERYKGIRIDLTAKTERELADKVYRRKRDIDNGSVVGSHAGTSVSAWAKQWLNTYKKGHVALKNYKTYEANLRLHILPEIGGMMLTDVRQYHLSGILNKHAGESESHIKHIKNAITGVFSTAYENELINKNPAAGLKIPSGSYAGHRALTDKEAELFVRACKGSMYGMPFMIIYKCGLRPSEILSLNSNNIKDKMIHISKSKTPAGIRDVPVPDDFWPQLKDYITQNADSRPLFATKAGNSYTTSYLSHRWEHILNKMDILAGAEVKNNQIQKSVISRDLTPYDLRHTYCTNLERAGVPINVAKYLMGHSSVEVTARIYTHKTDEVIINAAAMINTYNLSKKSGQNSE